jgi:molybdopterin converting factor subunit 1
MNHIRILFFATLRDRAGAKALEIDIPEGTTVRGVKDRLSQDFPNLKQAIASVLVSINREYAFDEAVVPGNAEVALFPPVSGG